MNRRRSTTTKWTFISLLILSIGAATAVSQSQTPAERRARCQKDYKDGNFKDAYRGLRKLALDPKTDSQLVSGDMNMAVQSLQRLGRVNEIDDLLESAVTAHATNWRLLQAVAVQYLGNQHQGYMISGQFQRGPHRGGGRMVNSLQRDRIRALQLMIQAEPLARADDQKHHVGAFYLALANQLLYNRGHYDAWRLQVLSNLDELPDYEEGYPYFRNYVGASVDAQGKPVYHRASESWDSAKTDGERWRWALEQAVEVSPPLLNRARHRRAQLYQQLYGVQSMRQSRYQPFFGLPSSDEENDDSGVYALHTLAENETIAKLATGIKRFELPDEANFIELYQTIAAEPQTGYADNALIALAQIFENRRQYPRAAKYWRQSIDQYGPGNRNYKRLRLEQIVGNWGSFETILKQPAGQGASIEYRFRNAEKVSLRAREIDVSLLLGDVKSYLKSDPRHLDWNQINIGNIGWRLVQQNQAKYLGDDVAKWEMKLQPRDHHFDRRITLATPLQKAGAYLLTAKLADGNTSSVVVWLADTAIVTKQLDGKNFYFVADAITGKPIPNANLEFFGYRQKNLGGNRYQILTTNFAEKTDRQGQVIPDQRDLLNNYQWLITARGNAGRLAYIGFQGIWSANYHDAQYKAVKALTITDRPVYRPQQTVQFKTWIRRAQYDQEDVSQFADKSCLIEIRNPKGEKVLSQSFQTDQYGALEGSLELPADAALGQYTMRVHVESIGWNVTNGGNTFRVEEYKKPEYEVTIDAPSDPVMLGETITAKITAKYYFGAPVTNATVKIKIMRSDYSQDWYPIAPWDWCYGRGYWWFCYDTPWYPGWNDWVGCRRPTPWWWHRSPNPPELVSEQELSIGPDGTVEVEIDTAVVKEMRGNTDHQYTITAEIRDESRRVIVGQGQVLVARKPFKVFTWVDRGYYRVGDTVKANFLAQTLDQKPVQGQGALTLLKISYDEKNEPVETPVRRWELDTNDRGRAEQQILASAKGQYRLSYRLTDAKGHTIQGGYLFTIIGAGFDGKDYRFNNIELIPDKPQYAPGETVKLQINTDRVDSTVLLFVRPSNGVYLPPKILRIKGKSAIAEIKVVKKDMPNFFVEAVTIYDGKVYSDTREIIVPPEKRILNVEVLPSQSIYKPGQKATVKVHLTDSNGENFIGSTVISIYDKSVEYISGGSNTPDIKEFFWKWRRQHQPNQLSSLDGVYPNIAQPNRPGMSFLGVFGQTVADEDEEKSTESDDKSSLFWKSRSESRRSGFAGGGIGGGGGFGDAAPASNAAPMAAGLEMSLADGRQAKKSLGDNRLAKRKNNGAADGQGNLVDPTVRSNFADTALWVGSLTTDATGMAEVQLDMPENLTTWKVKVWGMGHGTKVGAGEAEVITRKNLILRLQAPRFFVQKDEVVLSANVHNYLKTDKKVTVVLDLPGDFLQAIGEPTVEVTVPANGEKRVDWRVKVIREGMVTVRMKALTDEESDAMQMQLPCFVHGMLKTDSWAGTVRPDQQSASLTINVPPARRVDQSLLEIRYSPTLAGAMVDALPYLADYPYGCTEQTLNRFLPAVVTQKVLREMNLNLAAIQEKRTNLNAQEIGDDVQRAAQWKRFNRNPVFDEKELDRMVKKGLQRLTDMQISDGGWGWFSGTLERSYPHTTAVVVHGLQIAKQNDVALVPGVLERGQQWLENYQQRQVQLIKNALAEKRPSKQSADNLDAFIYMVLVDAGVDNVAMRDYLYRDRTRLAVYAKAMFGLALEKQGQDEKLTMILRNIEQFLVQDEENETAYLKLPAESYWWHWYGSETEANAYYLKLLSRVDARSIKAPRLVKYLLNNRKHATYWSSTRDTAICVEAFSEYIRASGEAQPDMVVEIWIDGAKRQEVAITGENLFTFDNKFLLAGAELKDGPHTVEIRRQGKGPVYFNAYLTNFTLEDHITRAGLEVKVNRKYYKLVKVDKKIDVAGDRGQVVSQQVEKYERQELDNLATLTSGDLVEIELTIESKNDYEYVIFEDMKPAGFETVDVRSGYTRNGLGAYMELRDERVSFFVRSLARGSNSISYRMRAEIPGRFSALPARAYAMYAPELRGNSDEIKLNIVDE